MRQLATVGRDLLLIPVLVVLAIVGAVALLGALVTALVAWGTFAGLRDLLSWRGRQ